MSKKVCLIILDGWGIGRNDASNAIYVAHTPFADYLNKTYPHAQLRTDGENVGLPDGQMGNSEVGHMNIGAGRVVYQDLVKINIAVRDKSFHENEVLKAAIAKAKSTNCKLHFIGLVSDGGVHSHIDHLKALCDMANEAGVERTYVHAFTDGRDTDPQSGLGYMTNLENHIAGTNVKVASVVGRYYAMDRDKRWERVSKAYQMLVHGKGSSYTTSLACLEASYAAGITDEFVEPSLVHEGSGNWQGQIENGDVVICFNYRTDRCREITQALTQQNFPEFGMNTLSLHYVTMTNYDETFKNVYVAYDKDNLVMTLGEVLEQAGKSQIRIAETEKYPHVTFFFSGGREAEFNQERRLMVNSPKVATYDLQPEMSAQGIADSICTAMDEAPADFICLNFANPDMVGHTGVFSAIVKAVETTDACLKQVVEKGQSKGYSFIVIADHGNADFAINEDGTPNTAHTTNPVPVWILDPEVDSLHNGKLADVAPTVLKLLGVSQPEIMTGKSLF
jgi:2,3-bisphosphoglycerate-independent phosphoglycerate mutase